MNRMTEQEYAEYMQRYQRIQAALNGEPPEKWQGKADDGPESALGGKITRWAKDKGYPCLNLRQSVKARGFLVPGWPDVTLVVKNRVIFIELKAKKGRLSQEQKDMAIMFQALGNPIHEVRSFKRFLEIVS